MTRASAISRLTAAKERQDTRAMHRAYRDAKAATERVLSKPLAARWWDSAKAKRKGWC